MIRNTVNSNGPNNRHFSMPAAGLWLLLLCLLSAAVPFTSQAQTSKQTIQIVYQQTQGFSQQLIEKLEQNLSAAGYQVRASTITAESDHFPQLEKAQLLIAVGSKTTQLLLEAKVDTPLLSVLMPKHIAESFKKQYADKKNWANLLIDQPVERQFHLISAIMGKHQRIGVLLGPYTRMLKQDLQREAKKTHHKLNTEYIEDTDHLTSALKALTNISSILITLPDPVIYNKRTIRGILLLSYRSRTPIIGFSQAYVKAGAIAAVFSQPQQISQQATDIAIHFMNNASFRKTGYYPDDFSVAVNRKVARSLGIHLESTAVIIQKIKQAEADK